MRKCAGTGGGSGGERGEKTARNTAGEVPTSSEKPNNQPDPNQHIEAGSRCAVRFACDRRHVYGSRSPHLFILTAEGRAPTLTLNFPPPFSASAFLRYRPSPARQPWRSSVLRVGSGAGNSGAQEMSTAYRDVAYVAFDRLSYDVCFVSRCLRCKAILQLGAARSLRSSRWLSSRWLSSR